MWGRNHKTSDKSDGDSYLAESVVPIGRKNFVTGRVEVVDKDELFTATTFRIGAYTLGYTRDFGRFRHAQTGIGANASVYSLPDAIKPFYGDRPFGVNVYLRVRLRKPE